MSSTPPWRAQSAQLLVARFEKKYPFIKVDATRIGSERMATRLVAEAQGRKVQADVVNQSGFDFYGVMQKGIFEIYQSPERAACRLNTKMRMACGQSIPPH